MKPKTNEQLRVLAQRGDAQVQEQLVKNNLGYIQKVANELYQSVGLGNSELGIDHDDLIQEGAVRGSEMHPCKRQSIPPVPIWL